MICRPGMFESWRDCVEYLAVLLCASAVLGVPAALILWTFW